MRNAFSCAGGGRNASRDSEITASAAAMEGRKWNSLGMKLSRRRVLEIQKIFKQIETGSGEDGLGMKLHAFDAEFAVAQAHDDAVIGFGGNLEVARKRCALDDQ